MPVSSSFQTEAASAGGRAWWIKMLHELRYVSGNSNNSLFGFSQSLKTCKCSLQTAWEKSYNYSALPRSENLLRREAVLNISRYRSSQIWMCILYNLPIQKKKKERKSQNGIIHGWFCFMLNSSKVWICIFFHLKYELVFSFIAPILTIKFILWNKKKIFHLRQIIIIFFPVNQSFKIQWHFIHFSSHPCLAPVNWDKSNKIILIKFKNMAYFQITAKFRVLSLEDLPMY